MLTVANVNGGSNATMQVTIFRFQRAQVTPAGIDCSQPCCQTLRQVENLLRYRVGRRWLSLRPMMPTVTHYYGYNCASHMRLIHRSRLSS